MQFWHLRNQLIKLLIDIYQYKLTDNSACHHCLTLSVWAFCSFFYLPAALSLTRRLTLFYGSSVQTMRKRLFENFGWFSWHVWGWYDSVTLCIGNIVQGTFMKSVRSHCSDFLPRGISWLVFFISVLLHPLEMVIQQWSQTFALNV